MEELEQSNDDNEQAYLYVCIANSKPLSTTISLYDKLVRDAILNQSPLQKEGGAGARIYCLSTHVLSNPA